ncbi:MAG: TonB-dependent receptor [Bacteroidia bacterium]|nr:TonB-dependent receptor [Bacteroidia bacterium]
MKTRFLLLFTISSLSAFSQTIVTGIVTDEKGEGIPGANVFIQDSYDGISSDADGKFSFSTDEKGSKFLVVTFVGYKQFQQAVELNGQPIKVNVSLREEINQLDAVVISAGSFTAGEEKRRTILKPIDIATTAGATADIAGALNTLPGTTKVGESGRLFVRGGDSNEARTFIDGMVVLDAYGPSAPNTPSRGRFLPFMFKGTSFSTGGYSAEYGQALSSALVLNSKDKAEMNQTDIGIMSVGADVAHTQVWDRASLSGKIQYTNVRPYFGMINQEVDWKTPPASLEGSAAYRKQIGKDGFVKFFGNFNQSDYSLFIHDILDPQVKYQYDLGNDYRYGNGSYLQSLNENWTMRGGLSYTYIQNKVKIDGIPLGDVEKGIHAKAVLENSVSDRIEIRFGGELIERDFEATRQNENSNQAELLSFREPITAAFTEGEIYASKRFVTKVGGRMEYNNLIDQLSVDPRLSVAYKPGKQGQFALAYGTFRQTSKNEYVMFNNNLNPEKADHYILNYQVINDKKTFRVETYYKKYYQLVKFENGNLQQLNNKGRGYAKGVEFFWRDNETIRNVDYWISYSYLDTERDYLYFPSSATPSFTSKHNFSAVYKHFVTSLKTQFGLTYSFASGRTYFNPNNSLEDFNTDKTPFYQDVSANIAYLPKSNLIIYLSCTNLLGRDNIFGYQYSVQPNANGEFVSRAIRQAAPRFLFVGVFITISKNKSVNQLPNL